MSPAGLITRPRKRLPDIDSVMKVDQFRTHLLNREIQDRRILKLVGPDTLADFGRHLGALHRPAKVDWAAKFGLVPTTPQEPPAPGRRPWLVKFDGPCANCGKVLTAGTEAIWRHRERRMLCLDCGAA